MRLVPNRHQHGTSDDHGEGAVLDRGWRYDAEIWVFDTFFMRGQLRRLRQSVLDLAAVGPGGRLLDVGCGTGTLALDAARLVGPDGRVAGVDPGRRQIARAVHKAGRAGLEIDFRIGAIQRLPFDDRSFDAVTSTLMMHHLPAEMQIEGLAEVQRVLTPGGRLVVADFDAGGDPAHGDGGHESLEGLIARAGFSHVSTDAVTFGRRLHGWSGAVVTRATSI